jgi:hypothetical protein
MQMKFSTKIRFSHDSGFYADEFMLTIRSSSAYTLRYTLDGSIPDETSPIYEEPILMEDASTHENVYSLRTDTSAGFAADVGYVVPDEPIDKCNVVRAALFNEEGECVSEASGVYFVGFDDKDGYDGMKILSIVSDPDNLFDYEDDIYVKGAAYDEPDNQGSWRTRTGNYSKRGAEWEREAIIDIFDEDRDLLESDQIGIRIHGGGSRAHAQKSLNLYARTDFLGQGKIFRTDFFGNGRGPHKMVLAAQGNDDKTKIKNYIVQRLAKESDSHCATSGMVPCVMFLNGEYWGVYYLAESYDTDYLSTHYDVDEEDAVMFKNDALAEGVDEDYDLRYQFTVYISNNDMQDNDCFEEACTMIDIESFVDYYALEIYAANQDWLPNNCAYWRTRPSDMRSEYYDGKWRWMLFDTDLWAVMIEYEDDTIQHAIDDDPVFASLIRNEQVQEMLRQRLMELSDIYKDNCDIWIDEWLEEMSDSVHKNGERFWGEGAIDEYFQSIIDDMRAYPENREQYLKQYMEEHFN